MTDTLTKPSRPVSAGSGSFATGRASRRELALTAGLLFVIAALIYGPHAIDGGFTIDDYGHAVAVEHSGTGIFADYWNTITNRPGLVVYIPVTHFVLGAHPSLHLALAATLAIAMSLALYAVLRRLSFAPRHAGAIAVLVLLFPWSDSSRFWAVAGHISLAIALGLSGLLLALRGLDARASGHKRRALWLHCAAVVLYATSVLTYEIAGGVLLLVGALYFTRAPASAVWPRWFADITVVVACLTWNALQADRPGASLSDMLDHAGAIADSGLTVLALAAIPLGDAAKQSMAAGLHITRNVILGALAAIVIAALVVRHLLPTHDDSRQVLSKWLIAVGAGLAVMIASWAIYIPADSYYNPAGDGVANRVNVMAAIGVVIVVYGAIVLGITLLLRGVPNWMKLAAFASAAAAVALAFVYAVDERDEQRAWARAASASGAVLDAIVAIEPTPPPGSTIYTFGHPGNERAGVSIFGASWDLKGATQLRLGDPTINAYPVLEGSTMRCLQDRVEPTGGWFAPIHGASYGTAYLVDVAKGLKERLDSQEQCESAISAYTPGPTIRPQ
jgi:hypothetical protein